MMLRMLAGDSARPTRRDMVRLPAGSAVSTYVAITASRTERSRSFRDWFKASNLLVPNNLAGPEGGGQVADQRVEPQPPLRSATEAGAGEFHPALLDPGRQWRTEAGDGREIEALGRAQGEIDPLQIPLFRRERLLVLDRRASRRHRAAIRLPRLEVPAARGAVERVRRGTDSEIGRAGPVGGVVTGAVARPRGVGHLIEPVARAAEALVREQVLRGVAVLVGGPGGPARHPARQRGALFHRQPVERDVRGLERQREIEIARPVALQLGGHGE